MRKKRLISLGFVALLLAAALTVAFANRGTAASTNTCPPVEPSCFNVMVAPIYVTTNQTGLVTAKFNNTNTATATHTVITITLPPDSLSSRVSPSAPATCSEPPSGTISCSFGNVRHDDTVKMTVMFTSNEPPGEKSITGVLRFAEGNDGTNDTITEIPTYLSVAGTPGSDKAGYCTEHKTNTVKNKLVPLVDTVGSSGQTATIQSLTALAGGLCTPVAAGVEDVKAGDPCPNGRVGTCNTQVSIVAFPEVAGTVTLLFPVAKLQPPTNASNFVLYELSILDGQNWFRVPWCPDRTADTDSCISSQNTVTKNGLKYVQDVLTVYGSPPDGHFGG